MFTMTYHHQGRDNEQMGVAPYYKVGSGSYSIISASSTFSETLRIANGGTIIWLTGSQTWELPLSSADPVTLKMAIRSRFGANVRVNDNGPGSGFMILEIAQ
jgi:hypothetical protein